MIKAAGILFLTKDRQALFLKRAGDGDYAGFWCIPGGKLEDGETAEQAAVRETREEAGKVPNGVRTLLTRTVSSAGPTEIGLSGEGLSTLAVPQEQVDFTTFVQRIEEPFQVGESEESTGFAWAPVDQPPEPLHPGCRIAIERMNADDVGVARMMAAGSVASPQHYDNFVLFDIRITGTGAAWREIDQEFAFRNPDHYLTEDFLAKCNGLPVIWEHPEKRILNTQEWKDRTIGTVILPYIKGDEVWGIAKIFDLPAASEMEKGDLSTSPTVRWLDPGALNQKLILENGKILLIEGKPSLLDHVAVCEHGVWDKGGDPTGVSTSKADSDMTEAEKKAADDEKARKDAADAAAAKVKADAEEDRWSKLMNAVADIADSNKALGARMDAVEKSKADAAKADDDEEKKKAKEASDKPGAGDDEEVERKAKDDKAKADKSKSDETEEEKEERLKREEKAKDDAAKVDAAKADAAIERRVNEILAQRLPTQRTDADYAAIAEAQARGDSAYNAFGKRAPRPMEGESVLGYRRRMATDLQAHSKQWKGVDLAPFKDLTAFSVIEGQIYADAVAAAKSPSDLEFGELREIFTKDSTGRNISTFAGSPGSWMRDFAPNKMLVTGIYNGNR